MNRKLKWISEACFQDTFNWSKSYKTNFLDFFEHISLHDSYWVTININTHYEAILIIELNAYGNKEYCLKSRKIQDWPYLIIKIPDLIFITFTKVRADSIIYETSSEIISKLEIKKLIELSTTSEVLNKDVLKGVNVNTDLFRTRIDDVGDGNIEILHKPEILVLLIEKNGVYIDPDTHRLNLRNQENTENKDNKSLIERIINKIKVK